MDIRSSTCYNKKDAYELFKSPLEKARSHNEDCWLSLMLLLVTQASPDYKSDPVIAAAETEQERHFVKDMLLHVLKNEFSLTLTTREKNSSSQLLRKAVNL